MLVGRCGAGIVRRLALRMHKDTEFEVVLAKPSSRLWRLRPSTGDVKMPASLHSLP